MLTPPIQTRRTFLHAAVGCGVGIGLGLIAQPRAFAQAPRRIVYATPGLDLPFWRYLAKGVETVARKHDYECLTLDSRNNAQTQLKNIQDAISRGVAGIVISPTDSSTAPSVLQLAKNNGIPVVIADIGTNEGDYASFISSNNYDGAHAVGAALAAALRAKGWLAGSFGISAISQARKNGQARTQGFIDGMRAGGVTGRQASLQQMQAYTSEETFRFTQDMLTANPDMRAIFVQTDMPAIGALRAIKSARRQGQVLVAAFDGVPEFVKLLTDGELVVAGMQQPWLMGEQSALALFAHLNGERYEKEHTVPILAVTSENIQQILPTIKKTVFADEI